MSLQLEIMKVKTLLHDDCMIKLAPLTQKAFVVAMSSAFGIRL